MADFTKFFVDSKTGKIKTIAATKITAIDTRTAAARVGAANMPGTDVNFFVSGSKGSKVKHLGTIASFGGDLAVSGAINADLGLSGSLTKLTDGTSYLAAGSNITITSSSNGQVVITGDSGASLVREVLSDETSGTTTDYSLATTPSDYTSITVYVNGVLRLSGAGGDYLYDQANNQVDFNSPPTSGSIVQVVYTSGGGFGGGGGSSRWTQDGTNLYPVSIGSNVGIGTAAPVSRLEVGQGYASSVAMENITVAAGQDDDAAIDLIEESGGASTGFGTSNAYGFRVVYDGGDNSLHVKSGQQSTVDTRVLIERSTGNVGIGTSSPDAKLEVETSTSDNTDALFIDANETGAYHGLLVDSESTSAAAIKATGYAAGWFEQDISSGYGLYVKRNIAEAGSFPLVEFRDDNTSNTQTTLLVRQDGSGDVLNLSTGSNEVLTVNGQGQLGVGTASPNEKITIEGAISLDEIAYTPAAVSGYGKIYVKSSDSKLYFKNDTGTEFDLLAAAASGAPVDATYVVLSANGTLTNERVIVPGDGIALIDSGSGSNLTLSQSVNLADFAFDAGHLNLAPHVMMTASSDSGTAIASSHTLTFAGGEAIDTSATGGTVTISAEDATTSNKGVASFTAADFTVSTGHISLDDNVVKQIGSDAGTATGASHKIDIVGGTNVTVTAAGDTVTIASTVGVEGEIKKEMLTQESSAGITDYNLQNTPSDGTQVQVYVNGLLMLSGSSFDYVYDVGNNQVDFTNPPQSGSVIQAVYTITGTPHDHGDAGFFESTTVGSLFTTGAVAFVGPQSSPAVPDAPADIGNDVFFFVSGAVGSKNTATSGTAVFGGDLLTSGNIFAPAGISGSLTNLTDGRSYLAAGPNITITSESNGQITISGGGGGGGSGGSHFISTTVGSIFTTGATAFVGPQSSPAVPDAPSDVGTDVFFFVSGSVGSRGSSNSGSAVFGGDVIISGSLFGGSPLVVGDSLRVTGSIDASLGFSGSLTKLSNGTSYLVAGSNITVTSASNGQVTIATSGGGGSVTVKENDGDPEVANVTTISFDNAIVTDAGSNTVVISGTIGTPEDGTYEDGLFTSFTNKTYTGVAIDRFNEVLKLLAPSPAPDLDDINSFETGTDVFLSFGSSNAVSGYTSVGASAGYGSAVDVNGAYNVATSSNNIRLAAFNHTQSISGDLNADVEAGLSGARLNYVSQSFGNAEQGYLHLEVNGAVIATASLSGSTDATVRGISAPGSGSGTYLNSDGSGFTNLSITGSAIQQDGNTFSFFQHRTGRYLISTSSQRSGWNYARVLHFTDGSSLETNYVEWINDSNSDALAASTNTATVEMSGSVHLSGVEYFLSGNMRYKVAVSNAYRNVYDKNQITFSSTHVSMSGQSKPTIDTGGGENHTKVLHLTGVGHITQDAMLVGAVTSSVNVTHPLKANLTNAGTTSVSGILLYRLSGSSTANREAFREETFRIQSGSFSSQSDVTAGSNAWSSDKHISASNGGHSNGLQFFSSSLRSPLNNVYAGDFRNTADGGSIANGPSENPNYSSQSGLRTFYRYFQNGSGATQYTANVLMSGSSSTIVTAATSLNSSRIRVFLKIPSGTAGATGWLDLASAFSLNSYEDNDGCYDVSFDSSLNAANIANFGRQGIANSEYICMRVEADTSWTGQVDYIEVDFGAGTGTTVSAPILSQVDADSTGVTSKLSFGSSKAITGYTSVGGSAGLGSAVDVNGSYQVATSSNNIRAATFDGSSNFEGDLNPQVLVNGTNYVAKSFDKALTGTLKLEVNGAVIQSLDLTGSAGAGSPGSGSGTHVTSDGSGFISFSNYAAAQFSNGVSDYNKVYRTGKYRVSTTDQRNGWNYARVIHTVTGSDRETSYVEWVNDNDSNALAITNQVIDNFQGGSPYYQSGIAYFVACSSSLKYQSDNSYENVYSALSSAVTTPTTTNFSVNSIVISGSGVTDQLDSGDDSTKAALLTGVSNSEELPIFVTHSITFSRSESLPGPFGSTAYGVTGSTRVKHPLKSNVTSADFKKGAFLVFTSSNSSDLNNNEYFTSEEYRIQSGTYGSQASVILQSSKWSSTSSMNSASDLGHYAGALIYNDLMISPLSGVLGGDYRSAGDGGSLQAPDHNPNYSSLGVNQREYERYFQNNTSNDQPQITITLYGDATLVARSGTNSGSLDTSKNVYCDVKIPGKTGYLDLAKPSPGAGVVSDGTGGLSGDLTSAIDVDGASNICTFNGETLNGTASSPEYVIIRITSHKYFTGKVSRIQVAYS